jgi:transposase-like protein
VRLVISDAHVGLKQAIGETLAGAAWQRCRVHFMRNLLAQVPKAAQPMVSAAVRMIFIQPDQAAARAQLHQVASALEKRYPKAATLLTGAEEDILAYMAFPEQHSAGPTWSGSSPTGLPSLGSSAPSSWNRMTSGL